MRLLIKKINTHLLNRPSLILLLSIFYCLLISYLFNQPTYCWGWDFPLEKDVAKQSWEEQPENIRLAVAQEQTTSDGNISCEDAHYNQGVTTQESNKDLSSKELFAQQQEYLRKHLQGVSMDEKAEIICNHLFEKTKVYLKEINHLPDATVRNAVAVIIKNDVTKSFWEIGFGENIAKGSLAENIVGVGYAAINMDNDLSEFEKFIIANINVQIGLTNFAQEREMTFEILFQNDKLYQNLLQKQYKS